MDPIVVIVISVVVIVFVGMAFKFFCSKRGHQNWVNTQYEQKTAEFDFSRKILVGRSFVVILREKDKKKTTLESRLINELSSGAGAHVRFLADSQAAKILNGELITGLDPSVEFVLVGTLMSGIYFWGGDYPYNTSEADFRLITKEGQIIYSDHIKCSNDEILLHKIIYGTACGLNDFEHKTQAAAAL